ncbi:Copper-sensing transcriptional repressor CsoR [bacterium HR35]|nr:Copper-sensing transcriptional repressor CsoR [bacterium HR35]
MNKELKIKILRRLNIIKGQIEGLRNMIENDKYCVDILIQSMAVKNALSGIEDLILENHLKTHVKEQFKNKKEEVAVKEILKIYKLAKRK